LFRNSLHTFFISQRGGRSFKVLKCSQLSDLFGEHRAEGEKFLVHSTRCEPIPSLSINVASFAFKATKLESMNKKRKATLKKLTNKV
jgi:hypothetical protein